MEEGGNVSKEGCPPRQGVLSNFDPYRSPSKANHAPLWLIPRLPAQSSAVLQSRPLPGSPASRESADLSDRPGCQSRARSRRGAAGGSSGERARVRRGAFSPLGLVNRDLPRSEGGAPGVRRRHRPRPGDTRRGRTRGDAARGARPQLCCPPPCLPHPAGPVPPRMFPPRSPGCGAGAGPSGWGCLERR